MIPLSDADFVVDIVSEDSVSLTVAGVDGGTQIDVQSTEEVGVVTITGGKGDTGPAGPAPPGGSTGQFFRKMSDAEGDIGWDNPGWVFEQNTPSTVWVINHNFGRPVLAVHVTDSAGTVCMGEIQHVSEDQTILRFGASFSGKAVLL